MIGSGSRLYCKAGPMNPCAETELLGSSMAWFQPLLPTIPRGCWLHVLPLEPQGAPKQMLQ